MALSRPVILFALANDATASLRLAEEERSVRAELSDAHDEQRVEFHPLGHTTLSDMYDSLNRFHGRIAIFHYSGHSDGETLLLEDTSATDDSLATLLGMETTLQLVFLNGCANYGQVEELFARGVKTVIATSAAIEDSNALQFSQQFYRALAAGKNIGQAFHTAVSFIQNTQASFEAAVTRSIKLTKQQKEKFPWGLYTNDESVLNWRLPSPFQLKETKERGQVTIGGSALQMQATAKREQTILEGESPPVKGVELETHDRRVQNSQGAFRVEGEVLIGRSPECDIVILDANVSRRHVRIIRREGRMYLVDQNSTNGTFWNDKRISQMPLTEDGLLRVDEVEFKVRIIP